MRSPHFFEPAQPPPHRKRHAIVSKKWPSSIWRYARRWSQRFSAGARRELRAQIAKPAPGNDSSETITALSIDAAATVEYPSSQSHRPGIGAHIVGPRVHRGLEPRSISAFARAFQGRPAIPNRECQFPGTPAFSTLNPTAIIGTVDHEWISRRTRQRTDLGSPPLDLAKNDNCIVQACVIVYLGPPGAKLCTTFAFTDRYARYQTDRPEQQSVM